MFGDEVSNKFQLTAARRRLVRLLSRSPRFTLSFNSQPPEGGWTNSASLTVMPSCFNSQPPEGGWFSRPVARVARSRFNSQPPEGGW